MNSNFVSLTFIISLVFFLIMERVFHACGIAHSHWHTEEHSNCEHSDEDQMETVEGNKKVHNSHEQGEKGSGKKPKERNTQLNISNV